MRDGIIALRSGRRADRLRHYRIFRKSRHLFPTHTPPSPHFRTVWSSVPTSTWLLRILSTSLTTSQCQKFATYQCTGTYCYNAGWCNTQSPPDPHSESHQRELLPYSVLALRHQVRNLPRYPIMHLPQCLHNFGHYDPWLWFENNDRLCHHHA